MALMKRSTGRLQWVHTVGTVGGCGGGGGRMRLGCEEAGSKD